MRRTGMVLVTGWLAMLFCAGAVQAAPAAPGAATQHADLAQQLRRNPAHVSDRIAREAPRPAAPRFVGEARRPGVATYAMALPQHGDAVYEKALTHPGSGSSDKTAPRPAHSSPLVRLLSLAVGPVLLLAAVGLLLRRRSRLRDLSTPFALPRSVFAAARTADEAGLRERASEEVVRLGQEVRTTQGDPAAVERALDAYAAAGTVLDRARGVPDLAGVFALIAEGRAALPKAPATLPLCFFHPLHGPALRRIPWRPPGRREQLQVAACETCLRAIRARRAPEVLTDRLDGSPTPYFELPAEDNVWAASGYGSLLSGHGDSLTHRVQRGDFTHPPG
ncbi:hypothetical protein [Streptomyces sp. NPDC054786]